MREITDINGQRWVIRLDLAAYRRIHTNHIERFLETEKLACEQLNQVAQNRMLLCTLLWEMCQRQAVERGLSEEDFFCSFDPSVIEDAYAAVVEAAADFFPYLRPMISRIQSELRDLKREIQQTLTDELDKIPPGKLVETGLAGLPMPHSTTAESPESNRGK